MSKTAVSLFVFITGYFSIRNHQLRLGKLAKLWAEVCFYSVAICLAYMLRPDNQFSIREIVLAAFPIHSGQYWFFTVYFGLMLLSPFLAKLAQYTSRKSYLVGLAVLAFLTLELYKFLYGYQYGNTYGTSLLFFVFLYYVGGYYSLYGNLIPTKWLHIKSEQKSNISLLAMASVIVGLLGCVKGIDFLLLRAVPVSFPYHSFTILVSIALFQLFANWHPKENRLVKMLCLIAPYTFAVYLIHDNNYVREYLWHHLIQLNNTLNQPYYLLLIVLVPLTIFMVCVAVDMLRARLFKLAGVDKLLGRINLQITI